jgi:imidazole glycerol-phosphate synthase subunit HisF
MRTTRVIPILLIHLGGVYKTTAFSNPKYIGDPINTIRLFNDLEVDEVVVLDIDATKLGGTPNVDMIKEIASEAFMPFTYGGGIKTARQVRDILKCGVEKVVINHAIQYSQKLISECASYFGSQCIVASIDYKKKLFKGVLQYDYLTGRTLDCNPVDASVQCEAAGAGELLVNSVDREGSMEGLDNEMVNQITNAVNIPVIISGGAGKLDNLKSARNAGASAIAAGSMFVYHGKQKGVLVNYPTENQLKKYLSD